MKWVFDSEVDRDDVDAEPARSHRTDVALGSTRVHLRPIFNVETPRDLWAWFTGHTMLREFGVQFWHRIAAYVSCFVLIVISMSLVPIVSVLLEEEEDYEEIAPKKPWPCCVA